MAFPLQALLGLQVSFNRCVLETMLGALSLCAAVADPRPDLAEPARTAGNAYAWWW